MVYLHTSGAGGTVVITVGAYYVKPATATIGAICCIGEDSVELCVPDTDLVYVHG